MNEREEKRKNDCFKVEYFIFIIESNDCQSLLYSLFNTRSLSQSLFGAIKISFVDIKCASCVPSNAYKWKLKVNSIFSICIERQSWTVAVAINCSILLLGPFPPRHLLFLPVSGYFFSGSFLQPRKVLSGLTFKSDLQFNLVQITAETDVVFVSRSLAIH